MIHNSTVRKITGAMFTQGMLSILNLIIGILIARGVTKDEYALYVLAFNIIQGTISYQNALINSPLTILSPAKEPSIRSRFISGLAFGQWLYCLPILAIVLICGAVFCLFTKDLLRFIQLLVLSFAVIASFFREFMRNVNYSSLTCPTRDYNGYIFCSCCAAAHWAAGLSGKVIKYNCCCDTFRRVYFFCNCWVFK